MYTVIFTLVLIILALILMALAINKKSYNVITIVISIIIVIYTCILLVLQHNDYYIKDSLVLIEVENKNIYEYYDAMHKQWKQEYYLYFDDTRIEVSKSLYNKTNISEHIIINKITTYNTSDDEIIKVEYESNE